LHCETEHLAAEHVGAGWAILVRFAVTISRFVGAIGVLNLTPSDEANQLLTNDPFALLVGMLLDQQFPMERAFASPQLLAERLGTPGRLDPPVIVNTSPDALLAAAKGPPGNPSVPKLDDRTYSLSSADRDR